MRLNKLQILCIQQIRIQFKQAHSNEGRGVGSAAEHVFL